MPNGTYENQANGGKYIRVCAGPQKDMYVHRLVAEAILGRELLPSECVDHVDGDPQNNRWTNIRVVTLAENTKSMIRRHTP